MMGFPDAPQDCTLDHVPGGYCPAHGPIPPIDNLISPPRHRVAMPQNGTPAEAREMMEKAPFKSAVQWLTQDGEVPVSGVDSEIRVRHNGEYLDLRVTGGFAGNYQPNNVLMDREEVEALIAALVRGLRGVA